MRDHLYQLVFQFASNSEDLDALVNLLQEVTNCLSPHKDVFVDGYDHGLGEFNIFIHTDTPLETFELTRNLLGQLRPEFPFAAGYRKFTDETYQTLWPSGSTEFTVS